MGHLHLFGSFQLSFNGEPISLNQPRLEELTALLAVHQGEPIPRAQIAYRIWPESGESQARVNLRNLLHKLRQAWPGMGEAIAVTRTHASWRDDSGIEIDVPRFELLRTRADQCSDFQSCVTLLTEAANLYRGDFLPNCFADWALVERERLRDEYAAVLETLIDLLLERRRNEDALSQAKALQRFDPLSESAYRRLIQSYAALDDRAAALRVYHTCASTLQAELGVEPSPATEALRAQLLCLEEQVATDGPKAAHRPRLVGRQHEWLMLRDGWLRAQQGEARCVLIWGEAGIGKTRLAEELLDWVQRQRRNWASSRSYAVEGTLTYAPVAEWLHAPRIRPALDKIDDLWRVELARLLPELLADRPDLPPPGPMAESWQQQRFFQGILHALQAAPAPLLLHLDDMQWSDAETLTLLQFLLHGVRSHPMLLVGGIRTEDASGNRALASFVEATRHADQLAELKLGPLSELETIELAALTSGEEIARREAESFYATSEGHPLYLIEAVRSGLQNPPEQAGARASSPSEIKYFAAVPPRIYNLLSTRLNQLSETAHHVASMAAVIGRDFDYEILHATIGLDEMALVDALDELWRRRIIREQTGDRYDFSHDRIREVAYQKISRARRRLYHRRVATALETVHRDGLDNIAGELAAHFAQAGDSPRACHYYRQAASVALAQHALSHAESMLDAALRHATDDPIARVELLHQQNTVFRQATRSGRWRQNLDEMQTLLTSEETAPPELQLVYLMDRSSYFNTVGYGQQGAKMAKAAIAVAEELGDENAIIKSNYLLSANYWRAGMMCEASQAFEKTAQLARGIDDRALEAEILALQALNGMFTDMSFTQVHTLIMRSLELAEAIDSKEKVASNLGKLGQCQVGLGMGGFDLAERHLRQAIELASEIGKGWEIVTRQGNLGVLFTNKGDYHLALSALDASFKNVDESVALFIHWINIGRLGNVWLEMGCLDRASELHREAREMLRHHGARQFEAQVNCDLGWLHLLSNRSQKARSELVAALDYAEQVGDLRLKARASIRLGYALEADGLQKDPREQYESGCDLHHRMEQHYYAMNARAGMARIAALQGDYDAALDHVVTIWKTIGNKEMDATIETTRTLRTCYTIFDAHRDSRADAVLTMARAQLKRRVLTISDPAHVDQFWQLEDHRYFHNLT